jgi:hypothetical protein
MGKIVILLMNLSTLLLAQELRAQSNAFELRDQKVIGLLNRQEADSIYALAGPLLKSQVSATQWKTIATQQVFPLTPFNNPVAVQVGQEMSKYKVSTKTGKLMLQLSYNKEGQLEGLLLPPFNDSAKQPETPVEIRNDVLAQQFLRFYNAKQTDSLVDLSSEAFLKKANMTKTDFTNVFETQLYQYGSISDMEFLKSRNEML